MTMEPVIKQNLNENVRLALNKYIRSLDYKQDAKLPPELEIAKSLNVSRATLRRTLDDMEQEGLIIRIHGKGTFVNPEAMHIKLNLSPGYEFEKMIQKSGFNSNVKVNRFDEVPATKDIAKKLYIPVNSPVYIIEKIYFANGHPAIISIDRFAKSILPEHEHFTAQECTDSIFDILRRKAGRVVTRDKIEIGSLALDQMSQYSSFASKMECPTCLVFHGINYDQNNQPIIYDTEFYDTNYIQFNVIRRKTVYE